jgi:hypothetical protein
LRRKNGAFASNAAKSQLGSFRRAGNVRKYAGEVGGANRDPTMTLLFIVQRFGVL